MAINFPQNGLFQLWSHSQATHQSMTNWKFESKLGTSWHWLAFAQWHLMKHAWCFMTDVGQPCPVHHRFFKPNVAQRRMAFQHQKAENIAAYLGLAQWFNLKRVERITTDLKVTASRYPMCQRDARRNLLSWAGDLRVWLGHRPVWVILSSKKFGYKLGRAKIHCFLFDRTPSKRGQERGSRRAPPYVQGFRVERQHNGL